MKRGERKPLTNEEKRKFLFMKTAARYHGKSLADMGVYITMHSEWKILYPGENDSKKLFQPVSYTHLTLPTN